MDINLKDTKIELIKWLTTIEDENLIQEIINLKDSQTEDWWFEISEKEKNSIKKGLKDIEEGRVVEHSEVRKIYEKWL